MQPVSMEAPTDFGFDDVDVEAQRRRRTVKWSRYEPDVLAAWVAEMDFRIAPPVQDAIADAVQRQQFGYPQDDSETGLPEAFTAWSESRHGWAVDPADVHLLPDVVRGVELAIEFFSKPASPVIVTTPAYMPFFRVPAMVGRQCIEVPLAATDGGREELDLDAIGAAFAAGAGSIILCHPYNPIGRSFSRSELEALATVVDRHGARVIADEIHAPLTYGPPHVPYASLSTGAAAHTLTVTSPSKAWNLAGLKCAVAVTSSPTDQERWVDVAVHADGASTIGIEASVAAYRDGGPWLDAVVAYLDETRTWFAGLLADQLPGVGYTPPEATYLAWLDCRALDLRVEPAAYFLDHAKVALNEGSSFGDPYEGFARMNLATSRSLLERMVAAMAASLAER